MRRILLIEESGEDAERMVRELERGLGKLVTLRVEATEELATALLQPWDAVIADDRAGLRPTDALRLLARAGSRELPLIVVFGTPGEAKAVAAVRNGARDYLLPGDLPRLAATVERELREAEARQVRRTAEEDLHLLEIENAKVQEGGRIKGELLAKMSHDLRTPLNSILGFSDVLLDGKGGTLSERQTRYVENINQSGRILLRLINDLLDLARIEVGRMEVHARSCDLVLLAQETVETLRPILEAREMSVEAPSPDPPIPNAWADPVRARQILYKLIANAIKFSPTSKTVTLRFSSTLDGKIVTASVIDHGLGISPDDIRQIFVPFTQLKNPKETGRTGPGLALVKRLADLMGGGIRIDSRVAEGSTFHLDLPTGAPD